MSPVSFPVLGGHEGGSRCGVAACFHGHISSHSVAISPSLRGLAGFAELGAVSGVLAWAPDGISLSGTKLER